MLHNEDALSKLSTRQCELLEFVASGISTSKGLAGKTGMTVGSIDTVLYEAAKILGATDRKDAAARFRDLKENSQPPSQLRISALPDRSELVPIHSAGAVLRWAKAILDWLKGPPLGGKEHMLRWDQITLQILRVAFIGMVTISALVLFVLGFFRTFG